MSSLWNEVGNEIDSLFSRKAAIENFEIGQQTTYRTRAKCSLYVEVSNEAELQSVVSVNKKTNKEILIIGNGSNLLIADTGFDGLVVRLGKGFEEIEINDTQVKAGAAVKLPVLARKTASVGLAGFEWAVGVPGTIGGAVKMNAGGHGSDMRESVQSVEVVDLVNGKGLSLSTGDLEFEYRTSSIESHQIVVNAILVLEKGVPAVSNEKIKEIVRWRLENQPGGQNAGSVFKNPEKKSAGELIEETGSKGFRVGTAAISQKHANFIQVDQNGRATDVYLLMKEIQRRVSEEFGIKLKIETQLIGFD